MGDTVNTSSRIEGMRKPLDARLTISDEVFKQLPESLQSLFVSVGKIKLRGKSRDMQLDVIRKNPKQARFPNKAPL